MATLHSGEQANANKSMDEPKTALMGMFNRKERWGLSWRGRFLGLAVVLVMGAAFVFGSYPFLAVSHPVKSDVLVVEGWVDTHTIAEAVAVFKKGGYKKVYTTGGPITGTGRYANDYSTAANVGAGRLRDAGMPADLVQSVPSRVNERDRTYSSAVALREWFRQHGLSVTNMNILTEDVHARRTRLLFQKAFGPDVAIGIIAIASPDYEPTRWWQYSEGVRGVIGETIAYVYARVFFRAPDVRSAVPGTVAAVPH